MDAKQRILLTAEGLFFKYGIKSITMDDVAKELGISKKTLYKEVDNKKDLVSQVLGRNLEGELGFMIELRAASKNAIEEMLSVTKHVTQKFREMNPGVIYDLRKYYRESWKQLEKFQEEFIFSMIKENIEKGKKEGLYRQDLHADIMGKLYVGSTRMLVDEDYFSTKKYTPEKLYEEFIFYHLRGIVTNKGLKLLEKLS